MKLDPEALAGGLELLRMAIDAGDPKPELLLRVDDLLKESRASLPQSQDIRALVEELRQDAEMLRDGHQKNLTELWHSDVVKEAAIDCDRAADALSCLAGEGWRDIESDPPPHDVQVLLWSPPSMGWPAGKIEARPFSTGRSGDGWSEYSQHSWATKWCALPPVPSVEEKLP